MRSSYINAAILNAQYSNVKVAMHGAVVVHRGKIVGNGYNKYKIDDPSHGNRYSIHAEVDAINNALRKISYENLTKCILIVVRVNKSGEINGSYPCQCCRNTIIQRGLKSCFYS